MFIIKNLSYSIGQLRLNISELDLSRHKVTAILGPSGSGKTTFFNILVGLYQPKNWSWNLNGVFMNQLPLEKRQLGVAFQHYDLFPHLTAEENILLIMKSRNNLNANSKIQLEKYKNTLKLNSCWKTKAENLSGGEKQRVSLLRALMSQPRALLLDEPLSALDEDLKSETREMLREVFSELKIPVLLITHDLQDAKALADHIVHFGNGTVMSR